MCYDPLRVVEELEGGAKEECDIEREVRVQDEGEAMDADGSDNEDTGACAEDQEMASRRSSTTREGLENIFQETPTPVALARASTYTPYRYQPDDDKKKKMAARPAHADSAVFALPCLAP